MYIDSILHVYRMYNIYRERSYVSKNNKYDIFGFGRMKRPF